MFNIKWGLISGGGAFILSLVLGIFSGAAFAYVLIRAVIFLVVFFAAGLGVNMAINTYLPELLNTESLTAEGEPGRAGGGGQPGSRINITLGGGGVLPEMYREAGAPDEVGDINDLISGAVGRSSPGAA